MLNGLRFEYHARSHLFECNDGNLPLTAASLKRPSKRAIYRDIVVHVSLSGSPTRLSNSREEMFSDHEFVERNVVHVAGDRRRNGVQPIAFKRRLHWVFASTSESACSRRLTAASIQRSADC